MTRRISFGGCALLAFLFGACQQTLVLDDLPADASLSGTGGKNGSSGSGGSGPTDASSDGRCFGSQSPPIPYTADLPQMLVALDRSSAMEQSFGSSQQSQLAWALSAILSEVDGNIGRSSRRAIQFSFLDFPDTASDCNAMTGCCSSSVTTNYNDFDQQANACNVTGAGMCLQSANRPTKAALSRAHDYYASGNGSQHSTDRYVLLVTDGDPAGACDTGCNDVITVVGDLIDIGVTTEMVAIGSDATCLLQAATAEGMTPSPYYVAMTPTDLSNQIDDIAQTVGDGGCRLVLSQPPNGQLTVVFNGVKQLQDSGTTGNGWNYGSNAVYLHGSLCQNFLQGNPSSAFGLQIYDGCVPDYSGPNP